MVTRITKDELRRWQANLEVYAETIQKLPDDQGDKEQLWGELFTMFDDAGAVIDQLLEMD